MTSWAWLDGTILRAEEARVSALDRGFLLGDGAFEVLRTYGGRPFRLAAHLDRLEGTLRGLEIPLPIPRAALAEGVEALVARSGPADVVIRISVTRGPGGEGYLPPGRPRPTVFAFTRPVPDVEALRSRGLAAVLSTRRRTSAAALDPAWKTTSGAPLVLARMEAARAGVDEAILLNDRGEIAEGSHTNVFVVREGRILTPPLGAGILAGVTRGAVIESSPVEEAPVRPEDLAAADEAFLTYTSAGPVPLVRLDGRPVGDGRPGPVFAEVARRFDDLVRREGGR